MRIIFPLLSGTARRPLNLMTIVRHQIRRRMDAPPAPSLIYPARSFRLITVISLPVKSPFSPCGGTYVSCIQPKTRRYPSSEKGGCLRTYHKSSDNFPLWFTRHECPLHQAGDLSLIKERKVLQHQGNRAEGLILVEKWRGVGGSGREGNPSIYS